MNLDLRSIADRGDLQRERLTLKANTSLDVGDFVLLQTGFLDDEVTTEVFNTFWFSYKLVSKDDLIVIYTRKGIESSKPLKERGVAHFFYWGLTQPIWRDENKAAVILLAPTWASRSAKELWRR